jgi:FlaA1/EpsC-like NDP-sugar epimerase
MGEHKKKNKSFFSGKYKKIIFMLLLDIAFCVLSYVFARLIFYHNVPVLDGYKLYEVMIAAVFTVVTVAVLVFFDCYNTLWRYAGRVEFFKVAGAYFVTAFALLVFKIILNQPLFNIYLPAPIIMMYLMFSILLSSAMRFNLGIRNYLKHLFTRARGKKFKGPQKRTLVYGAGYNGTAFVTRCIQNPADGYFPVCMLDDDFEKQRKRMHGVTVVGGRESLKAAVDQFKVELIVLAVTSLKKPQLKSLYTECINLGVPVKTLTDIKDAKAADMQNATLSLRDIKIEELLGREEFNVDEELLYGSVKDKTVLVTGGAGSIGGELCRQALIYGCKRLIVFDNHENGMFLLNEEFKVKFDVNMYTLVMGSVREPKKLAEVFNLYKPDIVFHAAAYKHVPMMEIAASEAVKNNVLGTKNVIEAAENAGVKRFIFISTDKAVNPANVMGASKRISEMVLQTMAKKSEMHMAAVRFGNVLGSNGSVIPIFLRQIKAGGPITLTDRNIKRYFMTIPEAVRLVLQAGSLADKGDVFVLDMGEPVYIYDLACDLIRINGLEPEKDIEINITGLRPGEKMFEELRYDKEAVDATRHEGIFVTRLEAIEAKKFADDLKSLTAAATDEDDKKTEEIIFSMVPSGFRARDCGKNAL